VFLRQNTEEKRQGKTREGSKSGVGLLERIQHGGGIKDREDKSRSIVILITEDFTKIKPTEPSILGKEVV
jgi:hypothetical protein